MEKEPKLDYELLERGLVRRVKDAHYAHKHHLITMLTFQCVDDEGAICYIGDIDTMLKEEQEKGKELKEALKRLKEFREQTEDGKMVWNLLTEELEK